MNSVNNNLIDGKYVFRDLVNTEQLRTIFDRFSQATGFNATIISYPANELFINTNYREVCIKFHRAFPVTGAHCDENRLQLSSNLQKHLEKAEPLIQRCRNGLVDGATPIVIGGAYVAILTVGQVLLEAPDSKFFRKQAETYGFDADAYLQALEKVPVVTEKELREVLVFLRDVIVMLGEKALAEIKFHDERRKIEIRQDIFNAGPVVLFRWKNREGWPVMYVSSNVKDVLGYNAEEFLSGKISYSQIIHKDDIQRVKEEVRANSAEKMVHFQHQPYRLICKDRSTIWVEDNTIIQRNSAGEVTHYYGNVTDITNLKKAEYALRQRENYLSALNKIKAILLTADTDDIFQQVVDILGPVSSASRTYIFKNHYSEKGELLTSQIAEYCAAGITPQIDNPELQNLPMAEYSPRWVKTLSKGKLIKGKIIDFPSNEREILESQDIKAILVIPIISDKEFIGFIGFDNCVSDREWGSAEENFLKAAANDLAQFIGRNNTYKQLKAQYDRFYTTMDAIDATVYVADMHTYELLFSNKAFNDLFGNRIGEKCYTVIQKGQTKPCSFCTNHLLLDKKGNPKEPYIWEFQNTITKRWYHLRDQAIRWPDGRLVRLEIATDITDIKKAEIALQESKDKYKSLYKLHRLMSDNIPDLVWAKDLNGKYLFANKALCEKLLIAKDTDEPIGKNDMFFVNRQRKLHPERNDWHTFGELCTDSDAVVLKSKKPERFDEYGNVQGKFLYLDVYKAPIFDDNGEIIGTVGHARIVTREKEIEKALKENEQRLRSLINSTPDIICFKDGKGRWLEANRADLELFALTDVDYRGKTDMELAELTHSMYREAFLNCKQSDEIAWQSGKIYRVEEVVPMPNGGEKVYDVIKVPLFEEDGTRKGLVVLGRDITARKQAEEALRESKENLRIILNSIGDGVIAVNTKGRITHINPVAEKLTGWNMAEAYNQPLTTIFKIINEDTGKPVKNPVDKVLTDSKIVGLANHTILISRNGARYNIADSAAPIKDEKGNTHGVVLIFRDVTEKLKTEQELFKSKKLESLGILAGGIAHDFNNLLTGLFGNIEIAKMKIPQENPAYSCLELAHQSLDRAIHSTKQLLTFAKGGDPILETVDLKSVLQDTVTFNLSGSKVKPRFKLPSDLWQVKADKGQISQVIANLTINAIEATPEGGVLYVEAENIKDPAADLSGNFVKITVRDEGLGISPKYLNKIFDPYFTTKQTGSGLGLATVHSIITKHDGRINVESVLEKGTTFTIFLPAETAVREDKSAAKVTKVTEHAETAARHILVMDDEEVVRKVVEHVLEFSGYTVDFAVEGREAIEKYIAAKKSGNPFDVVIMDLTIPGGVGGIKAVKEILTIDPGAKVIVASGYSTDPVMANYQDYGFKGRLAKPFKIEDLKKEIARVLVEVQ